MSLHIIILLESPISTTLKKEEESDFPNFCRVHCVDTRDLVTVEPKPPKAQTLAARESTERAKSPECVSVPRAASI